MAGMAGVAARRRPGGRPEAMPTAGGGLSPEIRILDGGEPRLLTDFGRIDPRSLDSYRAHGGYTALERAIRHLSPEAVIGEMEAAGLRGRGGAGFPTAQKWRAVRATESDRKIVVANLMGADPTSLGDRALAEGNPHLIVEGVQIAAFAVGASEAIIAVRRDWQTAVERLRLAVDQTASAHLSGYLVLGTDVSIQLSVEEGSGAYVAGEETALLDLLPLAGGGTGTVKALFVGGPGGGAIEAAALDTPYDYDALGGVGAHIGSGSVLVTDEATCMVDTARFFLDFSAREACGKAV